jgi:hypothetical protein
MRLLAKMFHSIPSGPERCSVFCVIVRAIGSQSNLVTTMGLDTYESILIWCSSCIGICKRKLRDVQDLFVISLLYVSLESVCVGKVQNLDANVQFLPLEFR